MAKAAMILAMVCAATNTASRKGIVPLRSKLPEEDSPPPTGYSIRTATPTLVKPLPDMPVDIRHVVPFAAQAVLTDPVLRSEVLSVAPSAALPAARLIDASGSGDKSEAVSSFHEMVVELNRYIPQLHKEAGKRDWPVKEYRDTLLQKAETNRVAAVKKLNNRTERKIGKFLKAAAKEAQAVVTRVPAVPETTKEVRLEICRGCPSLEPNTKDERLDRCKECGCFVALKTKWRTQKCPIGKW